MTGLPVACFVICYFVPRNKVAYIPEVQAWHAGGESHQGSMKVMYSDNVPIMLLLHTACVPYLDTSVLVPPMSKPMIWREKNNIQQSLSARLSVDVALHPEAASTIAGQ
jgi:hypothetical protein